MIDVLDDMISALLLRDVPQLTDPLQIRFEPPGREWSAYLTELSAGGDPVLGVNCCPVELRENAQLRSNEMVETPLAGTVVREPAPMRVDVHYLVTAWDSAQMSETIDTARAEQKLIYAVLAALVLATPLNATQIYGQGAVPNSVPDAITDFDLPTRVVPPEGYSKLAEFWGSMGETIRWRPAVYLVVTLPVLIAREIVGEPVTTELVGYGLDGLPVAETRASLGVEVLTADGKAIPGAWVRLETKAGAPLRSGRADDDGHILFADLPPGSYVLTARAAGHAVDPDPATIHVPSANGGYRVTIP